MNQQTKAYIYAISAVLLWSTVATAFRLTLEYLNYLELIFISTLTATLFLFLIIIINKGNERKILKFHKSNTLSLQKIETYNIFGSKKDVFRSAILGFLNPFLYYILLFKAYTILPAQEALTLNYTWAVMLVLLSIIILKQKINIIRIVAILISFFGVIIIATHGNFATLKFSNAAGTSLALGSSVLWALYWIYNMKDKRNEIHKLFLNFLFGFIYISILIFLMTQYLLFRELIPDTHISNHSDKINTMHIFSNITNKSNAILGAIYIGLFEMGVTFYIWIKSLKLSANTAQVSNLIFISPFISLLLINTILGEKILLSTIIGLIFVIIGIILQQMNKLINVRN